MCPLDLVTAISGVTVQNRVLKSGRDKRQRKGVKREEIWP